MTNASSDVAPVIVWFRNDLRLKDNPALHAARESGAPVIALYILDEDAPHAPGGASRWWLHHSLKALAAGLKSAGTQLVLRRGDSGHELKKIVGESEAKGVFWNRRYFAKHIAVDKLLKSDLEGGGVKVVSFNGALLREPWEVKTNSGGHYRVYSPFWRTLRAMGPSRSAPLPALRKIAGPDDFPASDKLDDWALEPSNPNWAKGFVPLWAPGERRAHQLLKMFLDGPVDHYADGRNRPDLELTSRLSPHLAFGEISPVQIWNETRARMDNSAFDDKAADKFLSEIAWREFSYNLLFHYKELPDQPLRQEFADYPWRNDADGLRAWREGRTGYPIVDAGMRQLWKTGWMHNRVRMIVASFLIKDLLVPWQEGEAWFWDTLVDADLANNAASWQWVAGCGADAAPYFRIFNPVSQGEKFDPEGDYVRAFVPELAEMPAKFIHAPWTAPESVLQEAGVSLGNIYPKPIIDHGYARRRALEGYDKIKKGA